jgi:hypothetical protein
VRIQDDAKILSAADRQSITTAANAAPFAVAIWTSTAYSTQAAFDSAVQQATGNPEVALAVDPVHKYSYIYNRGNTGLTQADTQAADQAANAQFGNGQWGAGFTTAINRLASAAGARGTTSTGNPAGPITLPSSSGGLNLGGGLLCCLIPLALIALVGFFFFRNRGMNRGGAPVYPANAYPPQYPNQGYGPGPYPPQGGYYPQQGSGIGGNIASGGLGALAGGAIGYELGRNAGEQQAGQQGGGFLGGGGGGGDFGSGGTFGGGDAGGGGGFSGGGGGNQGGYGGQGGSRPQADDPWATDSRGSGDGFSDEPPF